MHPVKKETFFIYEGMVFIELSGTRLTGLPGDRFTIMPGTKHRFGSKEGGVLIETSTHHDDDDVVRFELSMRIPEPEGV
jgi:D-lyxose ketol-isomerase